MTPEISRNGLYTRSVPAGADRDAEPLREERDVGAPAAPQRRAEELRGLGARGWQNFIEIL